MARGEWGRWISLRGKQGTYVPRSLFLMNGSALLYLWRSALDSMPRGRAGTATTVEPIALLKRSGTLHSTQGPSRWLPGCPSLLPRGLENLRSLRRSASVGICSIPSKPNLVGNDSVPQARERRSPVHNAIVAWLLADSHFGFVPRLHGRLSQSEYARW